MDDGARARAKEHIQSIQKLRNISENLCPDLENDWNLRDLAKSLSLFSDQLYSDETHFIWELLQNADDNSYAIGVVPEVRLVLTDRCIHFWSNEVGFSHENVNSLVGVAHSSKGEDVDTIGEKGIGFKSLFKVADAVTVRSEPYCFKLDTASPLGSLGMIVPVWVDPDDRRECCNADIPAHGTLFTLQPKPGFYKDKFYFDILTFDFSFLLFTRKIKSMQLVDGRWNSWEVTREGSIQVESGTRVIKTSLDGNPESIKQYAIFQHTVHDMPQEASRQGQAESIVTLAFPQKNQEPSLEDQQTYAFLPIDHFGFQFLIHADFVLIANRKDIQGGLDWNNSLRQGVVQALLAALFSFATSPIHHMAYAWPEYLECLQTVHNAFLKAIALDTISALRSYTLIQTEQTSNSSSTTGNLWDVPQNLLIVGSDFRDAEGELLLNDIPLSERVVANFYSFKSMAVLRKLGARDFIFPDFVEYLTRFVKENTEDFQQRPSEWHSSIAAVLLTHLLSNAWGPYSEEFSSCKELPMVPLRDGKWCSAVSDDVLLPGAFDQQIPGGLTVRFVSDDAAADNSRHDLFKLLGIRSCDESKICRLILDKQSSVQYTTDLIAQTVFLFRARYSPETGARLGFINSAKYLVCGRRVHVPFGYPGRDIRLLFDNDYQGIDWLHSSYETAVEEKHNRQWLEWLCNWPDVYIWPAVVADGHLSPHMRHILEVKGSRIFLSHLKEQVTVDPYLGVDYWNFAVVTEDIKTLSVSTNAGPRQLSEAVLPCLGATSLVALPILEVDEPEDEGWGFLQKYGVLTAPCLDFYFRQLKAMKAQGDLELLDASLSEIYQILEDYSDQKRQILETFEASELIHVGSGRWKSAKQCVWKTSFPCSITPVLSELYGDCRKLFRTILDIKNAGMGVLIRELEHVESCQGGEQADAFRRLLPALDRLSSKSDVSDARVVRLNQIKMFPVSEYEENDGTIAAHLAAAHERFWIADIPSLKSKFQGLVPIFDTLGIGSPQPLVNVFRILDMGYKKLSVVVKRKQSFEGGAPTLDRELTSRLQKKVPYILGIVAKDQSSSTKFEKYTMNLRNLEVYQVQNIRMERYILENGIRLYGRSDEGAVVFEEGQLPDSGLQIYIKRGLGLPDFLAPLTDQFVDFFGLGQESHMLLSRVLPPEKTEQFLESLEKAGVRGIFSDQDPETDSSSESSCEYVFAVEEASDLNIESMFGRLHIHETQPLTHQQNPVGQTYSRVHLNSHPSAEGMQRGAQSDNDPPAPWKDRSPIPSSLDPSIALEISSSNTSLPDPTEVRRLAERLAERMSNISIVDVTSQSVGRNATIDNGIAFNPTGSTSFAALGSGSASATEVPPMSSGAQHNSVDFGMSVYSKPPVSSSHSNWPSSEARRSSHMGFSDVTMLEESGLSQEIGYQGEYLLYKMLEQELYPHFTSDHWTSNNRNRVFDNHFGNRQMEKYYADFTYRDDDGKLGKYIAQCNGESGVNPTNHVITYHLEVKTTLGGLRTPVLLSNNQIQMAKRHSLRLEPSSFAQTDIYVLVRICDLGGEGVPRPKLSFFVDPWDLVCRNFLTIKGEKGIYVRPSMSPASHGSVAVIPTSPSRELAVASNR